MKEMDLIVEALRKSWGADTAYDANDWTTSNPARGQCVVSCLIIQDYFGGSLARYSVLGEGIDETHYVNKLSNGAYLDTTADQYNIPVTLELKPVAFDGYDSIREKRLSDEDTAVRYALLSERVKSHLKSIA